MSAARLSGYSVSIDTRTRGGESVTVLDGVELDVPNAAVTALVGESGCGKSLVALSLCGVLPPGSTQRGRVEIAGSAVRSEAAWRALRGRDVALVPQSPITSFTPVRTLGSHLAEVIRVLGSTRSPEALLERVHLPASTARLYPHELSGGMAQRAAIAAALAGAPALVVADEPTSALDPALADSVWRLLADIAADGSAVLVITHDLRSLVRSDICSSIAVMRHGRISLQDEPSVVLGASDDYVKRLFAGVSR